LSSEGNVIGKVMDELSIFSMKLFNCELSRVVRAWIFTTKPEKRKHLFKFIFNLAKLIKISFYFPDNHLKTFSTFAYCKTCV